MDILKRTVTQLSQYTTVRTEDVRDGVYLYVSEHNIKGGLPVVMGIYLDKRYLTGTQRAEYLAITLQHAIESINDLFKDCDSADCKQCHGSKVEHIA